MYQATLFFLEYIFRNTPTIFLILKRLILGFKTYFLNSLVWNSWFTVGKRVLMKLLCSPYTCKGEQLLKYCFSAPFCDWYTLSMVILYIQNVWISYSYNIMISMTLNWIYGNALDIFGICSTKSDSHSGLTKEYFISNWNLHTSAVCQ